jgi:predicted PurR-regulated permease PerM
VTDQLRRDLVLRIPFTTLVKVALFLLLVLMAVKLLPLVAIIYVAAMVAVVMSAASDWLEKHRVGRTLALTLTATAMFACVLAFLLVVVPLMVGQLRQLVHDAPRIGQRLSGVMPAAGPYIQSIVAQVSSPLQPGKVNDWMSKGATAGWYAIVGITALFLTLVIAVYFVVEGRRALAWLFSFAPEEKRRKLVHTVEEVEPVMLAYMRGQLITSTLAAAVALGTLVPLGVPAAIPLAVLAFVGDFVPVLGFIASIVPAIMLALAVSPAAALIVLAAYVAYHLVENYYVIPRVYGKAMRLSTLTVLLSVSIGGIVAGPAGAVLILPIAAAYPPIERIWLRPHLAPDTVPKHEAIEGEDEERAERVAEDVMRR